MIYGWKKIGLKEWLWLIFKPCKLWRVNIKYHNNKQSKKKANIIKLTVKTIDWLIDKLLDNRWKAAHSCSVTCVLGEELVIGLNGWWFGEPFSYFLRSSGCRWVFQQSMQSLARPSQMDYWKASQVDPSRTDPHKDLRADGYHKMIEGEWPVSNHNLLPFLHPNPYI